MKAINIKNKTFKKKVSGYDKKEVDTFLMDVTRAMDNLETDNQRLQQELYDRNAELDEYHGKSETLNRSIVVAQEAADRLRESALDEAELIVQQAETEARRIIETAVERANKVNAEADQLQESSRMYLHQSIGMAAQAKAMFEDKRWVDVFDEHPTAKVETPELDHLLAELDLPVRNQEAAQIFDTEEKIVEKEKEKEAFFNNDAPAILPEEVQRILEEQGKQTLAENEAEAHEEATPVADESASEPALNKNNETPVAEIEAQQESKTTNPEESQKK